MAVRVLNNFLHCIHKAECLKEKIEFSKKGIH